MMVSSASVGSSHHVRIQSATGLTPLDLGAIYRSRELLLTLVDRDIKLRYKQTALGVAWVLLQPLMASLIFAFIFGVIARLPSEGVPYYLFAFAGLLAWNTFANAVSRASYSLVGNGHMISKVYFPRLILPLASVASTLVDFAVSLAFLLALLCIHRIWPGPRLLLLPAWLAILLMMGLGIGLLAGAWMVKYRDVGHIIPTFLQLGLYISPVALSTALVPEKYRWIYDVNPITGVLEAFRWSLLKRGDLPLWPLVYSTATAALLFWVGAVVFKREERDFADVI